MSQQTPISHTVRPGDPTFLEHYGHAWSAGDEELLRTAFAEDGVYVDTGMGQTYRGVADVARFFRHMLRFSSATHVDFTSIVVQDDAFTAEWTWSGTADGSLSLGATVHPATGRRYSVPGVAVCRVDDDGLVTYHRDYYDVRDLTRQVGIDL